MRHKSSTPNKLVIAIDRPIIIALARLATIFLTLCTAPLIARTLGPEGRGLYAACIASVTLSPILLGVGIPVVIRRHAAVAKVDPYIRGLYKLTPFLIFPAIALALPIYSYFIPNLSSGERTSFVIAMAASVLFVITLCAQSVFVATSKYSRVALLQAMPISISTALILTFYLVSELTLTKLLHSYSIAMLATAIMSVALLRIGVGGPSAKPRNLIKDGSKYAISQAAESASFSLYQLLAVTALSPEYGGYLAVGMTIASLPMALAHSVGAVAFRVVAQSVSDVRSVQIGALLRVSGLIGLSCTIFLIAVTPIAVPLVFGTEFSPGIPLIVGVLLGCTSLIMNYVGMQMLAATGKGLRMAYSQLLGLAIGVSLMYVAGWISLPIAGGIAVAAGWIVTTLLIIVSLPVRLVHLIPRPSDGKSAWAVSLHGRLPVIELDKQAKHSRSWFIHRDFPSSRKTILHMRFDSMTSHPQDQSTTRQAVVGYPERSALITSAIYLLLITLFSAGLIVKALPVGMTVTIALTWTLFVLSICESSKASTSRMIAIPVVVAWTFFGTLGLDLSSTAQRYLVIFPLALLVGYALTANGHNRSMTLAYLRISGIMAILAILEKLIGRSLVGDDDRFAFFSRLREFRSAVATDHPLILAIYLTAAVISVGVFDLSRIQRLGICALLCLGVASTDGRVSLLVAIVASTTIVLFRDQAVAFVRDRRGILGIVIAAISVTLAYLSVYKWTNSAYGTTAADSSAAYRPAIYSLVPDMLRRNPTGLGFSKIPHEVWLVRGHSITYDLANTVDSEVVLLAIRFGYLGLALLAGVLAIFLLSARVQPVISAMGIVILILGLSTAITAWNTLGSFTCILIGSAIASIVGVNRAEYRDPKERIQVAPGSGSTAPDLSFTKLDLRT